MADFADQAAFTARFDWGEAGLRSLAPGATAIVIVDTLSFGTAVSVAVERGAIVYPHRWSYESALERAEELQAELAVSRRRVSPESPWSLSPATLHAIPPGTRLVLPSPNGATLSSIANTFGPAVIAGCLRNASAVGGACAKIDGPITVIAAGERWRGDLEGAFRPAFEDLIGAGAILASMTGKGRSPEAEAAVSAFRGVEHSLRNSMAHCASGRELIEAGYPDDVTIAAEHDASDIVSWLVDDAYRTMPEHSPR